MYIGGIVMTKGKELAQKLNGDTNPSTTERIWVLNKRSSMSDPQSTRLKSHFPRV